MIIVVDKQAESLITGLSQKARASGIHLILPTQRLSVDVITGSIKANIPYKHSISSIITSSFSYNLGLHRSGTIIRQ